MSKNQHGVIVQLRVRRPFESGGAMPFLHRIRRPIIGHFSPTRLNLRKIEKRCWARLLNELGIPQPDNEPQFDRGRAKLRIELAIRSLVPAELCPWVAAANGSRLRRENTLD